LAVVLGFGSATIVVILERFVFWNYLPKQLKEGISSAVWKRSLATLYGGIAEEVIVRLFFMSLFAWALSYVSSNSDGLPSDLAMWIAIALAALVFGLLHLPATLALTPLTRFVIFRTLVLNGVVGIAARWVYWQYGLLAAMATHWCADLVILLIAPSFIYDSKEATGQA
jgi:membrane protease YdiL (CAAX protease family)